LAADYCWLMRRDLSEEVPAVDWPTGLQLTHYRPELAAAVHGLMAQGHDDGGGRVPMLALWRRQFETDPEYDPQLCFVLQDAIGVVAVCQCWTSAYIKNLVVHERARRQGLGRALLLHAFKMFQQRREGYVDLKVLEDNLRARRLYERVGMYAVRRESVPV
jgi:ribosomal protein S18 acetylase RimI-like enzyme